MGLKRELIVETSVTLILDFPNSDYIFLSDWRAK